MTKQRPPIMAIHATSIGFGFVVMSGPFSLVEWGTRATRSTRNSACLSAVVRLLDRFDPHTLVLEEPSELPARSKRVKRLYIAIAAICHSRSIEVALVYRKDIYRCYASVGARTWQDIAEAVGRQLEPLSRVVPKSRKPWQSERRGMATFAAAAIAMTHWQSLATADWLGTRPL